jgi:hypothetical protein
VNVGQPEIAAGVTIRQPGVIEPEAMQDGCVEIVYVHFVLRNPDPEFV